MDDESLKDFLACTWAAWLFSALWWSFVFPFVPRAESTNTAWLAVNIFAAVSSWGLAVLGIIYRKSEHGKS